MTVQMEMTAETLLAQAKTSEEREDVLRRLAIMELVKRHDEEFSAIMEEIELNPKNFSFQLVAK